MWKRAYAKTQEDDRERTIEEFIPIIKNLAYKISKGFEDNCVIDDLISAGVMGLLEAMEKFDLSRGIKLNTFAYLRIRGAMIDELRARDWFPRSARSKAKKIGEVIRKLENKLGRYPDEEEVAEALNMDPEDYLTMLKDYGNLSILSIEGISEISGEDRDRIIQYVIDESEDPEQYAEFHEIEGILTQELDKLPERQKLVISLYYLEDLNMKEIAGTMSITEARVCQIHSQAIMNLRTSMKKHLKN
jgi:RNA polymerase sigma factor for flagellar operon FliA